MRMKENLFYTLKDTRIKGFTSNILFNRGGFIDSNGSLKWDLNPIGYKLFKKIETRFIDNLEEKGIYPMEMVSDNNKYAIKKKVLSNYHLPFLYNNVGIKRNENETNFNFINSLEYHACETHILGKNNDEVKVIFDGVTKVYKQTLTDLSIEYAVYKSKYKEKIYAITEDGEDLVYCSACHYASFEREAPILFTRQVRGNRLGNMERVIQHGLGTMEEKMKFFKEELNKFLVMELYYVKDRVIAILNRADRQLSLDKIKQAFGTHLVKKLTKSEVEQLVGCRIEFIGPYQLNIPIVADNEVKELANFVIGGNQNETFFKNVNIEDLKIVAYSDFRMVVPGDVCPVCQNKLSFRKGILLADGLIYGKTNLFYKDKDNHKKEMAEGIFTLNLYNAMASLIEQHQDEEGINFPKGLEPFKVDVIVVNADDKNQMQVAEQIYQKLKERKVSVIYDDRRINASRKVYDSDLIGCPIKIVIGKELKKGLIDIKYRAKLEMDEIKLTEIDTYLDKMMD